MKTPFFEYLEWDSKQLDIKCGIIRCDGISPDTDQYKLLDDLMRIIYEHKDIKFITIKLPGYFPIVFEGLIKKSAKFIDTELIYKFGRSCFTDEECNVSFVDTCDPDCFIPLVDEMVLSRFYMDENIPKDKACQLWTNSIKNYCTGRADRLAIAYSDSHPAGLVTINYRDNNTINLHIVGVLKQYQKLGLGYAMLSEIIKRYESDYDIGVETLSMNEKAMKLYRKAGFMLDSMQYVLHIWR